MHEVEYIGGPPRGPRDRSPLAPWLILGGLSVAMVVFMQWFRGDLFSTTLKEAPPAVARSEAVEGGQYSDFAMNAKSLVKLRFVDMDAQDRKEIAEAFQKSVAPLAASRAERLRAAIVAGELVGREEALSRIAGLQQELDLGTPLASDAAWLKILYERGPTRLNQEVRASLVDRRGWFGHLALAFEQPVTDPHRRTATLGRERILSTFRSLRWAQIGLFILGIVALALLVGNRDTICVPNQFEDPVPDENIQAFALFCAGFVVLIGISLLPFGLSAEGSLGAAVASELMIWSLLAVPLWPLVRGVSPRELSRSTGLHSGSGIPIEVLFGLGAFLAWMPLAIGMNEALAAIQSIFGSAPAEGSPSGHPMFEAPPSDSGLLVFLSITASVVWAPVVEEIVFRGFLYGWLRERLGVAISVIISSVLFGIVHPYSPLGMVEVAAAGVMFALLREWRGSLIAPMVAHALHNGSIEAASLAIAGAIGG